MAQIPFKTIPVNAGTETLIRYINTMMSSFKQLLSGNLSFTDHIDCQIVKTKITDGKGRFTVKKSEKPIGILCLNEGDNMTLNNWKKVENKIHISASGESKNIVLLVIYR